MADAHNTLAYLLNFGSLDVDGIDVSDLLLQAPFLAAAYAKSSSHGQVHKYLKRTVQAGSGFRAVNTGVTNAAGESALQTITLKFLDASFDRDIAIIKASGGAERYMTEETLASLKAAMFGAEKSCINGIQTEGDSDGFLGLADELSDIGSFVLDAEGDSAGAVTSIYAVRFANDAVSVVAANGGEIDISDPYSVRVQPDGADVAYSAMRVDVDAWMGLQLGSSYDAARIGNVTTSGTADATTCNDKLLSDLMALAKAGMPFTHFVMNRTSQKYLQQSRTAVNATGKEAPFPTEAFGLPIITTDAILNTETILT